MREYAVAGINRTIGIGEYSIATVWGLPLYNAPAYDQIRGLIPTTLSELADAGLLDQQQTAGYYKPSQIARNLKSDLVPLWQVICAQELDDDEATLLRVIADLSERRRATYADIDWVQHDDLLTSTGWDYDQAYTIAEELRRRSFIGVSATMGAFRSHVTYRGLVWLRKQGETTEARWLDDLLREGETTSVEIKREQHTDTKDQKAELVKDLLALANTKTSGSRWLVVGFDDKSFAWHSPPDSKLSQNHLEQLLSVYTEPMVELRYTVTEARGQQFAKIEVLRDASKLPYRVKATLRGEKREIRQDQVFVRHGSQVEEPTEAELNALIEEGQRTRGE